MELLKFMIRHLRHIVTLWAILTSVLSCMAYTISDFFANDIKGVYTVFTINPSMRLDLIDYYMANYNYVDGVDVHNGKVLLDTIADDYMHFTSSEATTTLWLAEAKAKRSKTIVMSIITIDKPYKSSLLQFCNAEVEEGFKKYDKTKFIQEPTIDDFITPAKDSQGLDRQEIKDIIDVPYIEYEFNPSTLTLCARQCVEQTLAKEDWEKISNYLCKEIFYQWKGTKFVRLK